MKLSTLILAFLICFTGCKKNNIIPIKKPEKFTITCNISEINDSISIVIDKIKLSSVDRIDSMMSKNGSFKITIPSDTIHQKYEIRLLKYPTKEGIRSFNIWSKDEDISISGTYDGKRIQKLNIEGCDLNNIEKKYLDIMSKYDTIYTKKLESVVTQEAVAVLFKKIMNLIHLDQVKFIYENPNNFISLTYIFMHKHRISQDSLSLYYNKLDTILQNSAKGKVLKELSVREIGFNPEQKVTYKDIRLYGLENDLTFLGYLGPDNRAQLIPKNEEVILQFLKEHRNFNLDSTKMDFGQDVNDLGPAAKYLFPPQTNTIGFFYCKMRRKE